MVLERLSFISMEFMLILLPMRFVLGLLQFSRPLTRLKLVEDLLATSEDFRFFRLVHFNFSQTLVRPRLVLLILAIQPLHCACSLFAAVLLVLILPLELVKVNLLVAILKSELYNRMSDGMCYVYWCHNLSVMWCKILYQRNELLKMSICNIHIVFHFYNLHQYPAFHLFHPNSLHRLPKALCFVYRLPNLPKLRFRLWSPEWSLLTLPSWNLLK